MTIGINSWLNRLATALYTVSEFKKILPSFPVLFNRKCVVVSAEGRTKMKQLFLPLSEHLRLAPRCLQNLRLIDFNKWWTIQEKRA